jgi:hypothetical protein
MDQLLNGRQMLYDRLENALQENADPTDMENIINALNIRTGSFGIERKNLINSLLKTIIEVTFPNFVKYLFWGSAENKGLFEDTTGTYGTQPSSIGGMTDEKRKKLSKYQLEELRNREGFE